MFCIVSFLEQILKLVLKGLLSSTIQWKQCERKSEREGRKNRNEMNRIEIERNKMKETGKTVQTQKIYNK